MATQTTGVLTSEMRTYYDKVLLEAAKPTLVHTRWAQERNIPMREGDTINFRRFEILATKTTAITEGVTPPGDDLTITTVTASPAQYGGYVTFSDKVVWTAIDPLLDETAELQGIQAGETLDEITRDVIIAGSTVRYAGASSSSRATVGSADLITAAELRKLRRTLRKNKARPINGYFPLIVSPDTMYDLTGLTEWLTMAENSRPEELKEGVVRRFLGFEIVETEKAKVATGEGEGGIDVHLSVAIGRGFYGTSRISGHALETIMKPLGSAGTADPLNQRQSQGWKATFAAVRLNENFGARLEHAVTA